MNTAYLNGRFVRATELTLSATDAGFVSGVTVTDFCRTYRHRLFRWPDHLARFRRDCAACRVPLHQTDAELTAAAERLAHDLAETLPPTRDLAVVTFATPGPLGQFHGTHQTGPPTLGMHAFALSGSRYRRFFTEGVTLAVAGVNPMASGGIVPTAAKHRSRLAWWLAEQQVADPESPAHCPGAVAVLTGADHRAADTAIGSVVAVRNGVVIRPPAGRVLEGISLGVLEELCKTLNVPFAEIDSSIADLTNADELLLVGSGFGVAGVRRLVDRDRQSDVIYPWPGVHTQRLIAAWSNHVGVAIDRQFDAT